jgi:hypothetical protein
MKHLKKFENTKENIFTIDEIADIINEFADAFDIEEVDDIIIYPDVDSYAPDPFTFLSELRKIDHGIESSFKIAIPYDYVDYDFSEMCDTNIEIFKNLKSLSSKMETFNVEIIPDYFWIDFDMHSIILALEKI